MKTSIYKTIALTYVTLLWPFVAFAQQPDSLDRYLETAAKNNPTVMQRFNQYQAALQKVPQVGGLPDPQLDLGVFLSPMELVGGNQVADIKLMQMFPWFGVIRNAKDEMSLMAKAGFETFRDAKLQVCYDVQRTWYEVYAVRRKIELSEKNAELLKSLERLALVRFRSAAVPGGNLASDGGMSAGKETVTASGSSGMGSMGGNASPAVTAPARFSGTTSMSSSSGSSGLADVYRIQMEIYDLENSLASLRNEEQVILARFNSLLNRPFETPVFTPESLPAEPLEPTYLTTSDSLFTGNPMLGMLQYEKQSLTARARMQRKMGLPMLGVGLNYSLVNKNGMSTSAMNGQDMIMPMVTLSLPIYRRKYKAMQSETEYLKSASDLDRVAVANALKAEYYEAVQLYNDAGRRMKLYESQSRLIKKILDISTKAFSSSTSGLTDVLLVRQQLLDYEIKQVEAVADYNKAVAWIKRLIPNP